jgi:hypothetical protein
LKYLYRTAAAFVSARLGVSAIPPLSAQDLGMDLGPGAPGGLIVAGSYVPKTTTQLKFLRDQRGSKLKVIELDVAVLVGAGIEANLVLQGAITDANNRLQAGEDVLIMTSRRLLVGQDAIKSLNIGSIVAAALVRVVQSIDIRPRYLIAKVCAVFLIISMFRVTVSDELSGRYNIFGCSNERFEHEARDDYWTGRTGRSTLEV